MNGAPVGTLATMRSLWSRAGRIPALSAFVIFSAALLAAAYVLDDPAETVLVCTLLALFVAYCIVRPHRRHDVFAYACMPGGGRALLHELFGISRHCGLLRLLLVLPGLREIDRESSQRGTTDELPGVVSR